MPEITKLQADDFVTKRFRGQAMRGRAFLTMAQNDAMTWAEGYGDYFAPGGNPAASAWTDPRVDVVHQVTPADVAALMNLFGRIDAVITPEDQILIDKF